MFFNNKFTQVIVVVFLKEHYFHFERNKIYQNKISMVMFLIINHKNNFIWYECSKEHTKRLDG